MSSWSPSASRVRHDRWICRCRCARRAPPFFFSFTKHHTVMNCVGAYFGKRPRAVGECTPDLAHIMSSCPRSGLENVAAIVASAAISGALTIEFTVPQIVALSQAGANPLPPATFLEHRSKIFMRVCPGPLLQSPRRVSADGHTASLHDPALKPRIPPPCTLQSIASQTGNKILHLSLARGLKVCNQLLRCRMFA